MASEHEPTVSMYRALCALNNAPDKRLRTSRLREAGQITIRGSWKWLDRMEDLCLISRCTDEVELTFKGLQTVIRYEAQANGK